MEDLAKLQENCICGNGGFFKRHDSLLSKTIKRAINIFLFLLIILWSQFALSEPGKALSKKPGSFYYVTSSPAGGHYLVIGLKKISSPIEMFEDIDIPGLPKINNFKFIYTVWDGDIGEDVKGFNHFFLNNRDSLWPITFFPVILRNHGKDTIIHEMYHSGFVVAMYKAGVDIRIFEAYGRNYLFTYDKKRWSILQLSEAVAEVGFVRKFGKGKTRKEVVARHEGLAKIDNIDYAIVKHLIEKAKGNPEAYLVELEKLIKDLLPSLKKID